MVGKSGATTTLYKSFRQQEDVIWRTLSPLDPVDPNIPVKEAQELAHKARISPYHSPATNVGSHECLKHPALEHANQCSRNLRTLTPSRPSLSGAPSFQRPEEACHVEK